MPTVLLATDGSDLSSAAMARGVGLLGRDHRFLALAVVQPAFLPGAAAGTLDAPPMVIDPALEHEVEEADRSELATDLDQLDQLLEIRSEHLLETGEPGPVICEVAERTGADVIVIGSHGHGWLQRVVLGSVSTYVSRHAPAPVLVIRLEDREA